MRNVFVGSPILFCLLLDFGPETSRKIDGVGYRTPPPPPETENNYATIL